MMQYGQGVIHARLDVIESTIGGTPQLRGYTGSMPANPAAAATGTLAAQGSLPADWMNAASGGQKTKLGTWTMTGQAAAGAGVSLGYFRIYDSTGTTCHMQGTIGTSVNLTTNALTAANGNVLNFASTTGVVVGMNVSGTGILPGTTVIAATGTTVTLSQSSTAGVANATAITFSYDLAVDNVNIANGQTLTVNSFTLTGGNA